MLETGKALARQKHVSAQANVYAQEVLIEHIMHKLSIDKGILRTQVGIQRGKQARTQAGHWRKAHAMAHEGLVKLIGSTPGLGAYLAHAQA